MSLLLDALAKKNRDRPPVWLMRQAGRYMPEYRKLRERYSFLELCSDPNLIVEVTTLPIDMLGVDAAILFSDILLVLQAMGASLHFDEGKGPVLTPLQSIETLSLKPISEKLSFLTPAIQTLKSTLPVPLLGFAGAPFTLASYLIEGGTSKDLKKTKQWIYKRPDEFEKLISLLEQAVIQLLKMQIDAGVDAVQIFDTWASALTEEHFATYSLKPLERILKALPAVPTLFFCKGSSHRAPAIAKTGVTGISIDQLQPLAKVRHTVPYAVLQGNLEPELLFSTPAEIESKVTALLTSMRDDPAFILNLSHGVLPETPVDHVKHLVETVKTSFFIIS